MAHDHCKMHKDTTGCLITSRIRSRWECFPWWAGWTGLARSHWEDDIWQTHPLHTSLGIQNTPTQRRGHLLRITLSQRRFHCTRSVPYQPHFFTVDHHALTHTHTHTHTHIVCSNRYYKLRGSLQAGSDSSPLSKRPRTTVSVGALHPGLQCWHAAACAFCQPSPTCHTAFLAHQKAFSAAGAIAWNSLPDFTWDSTSSTDCFRRLLKTNLFAQY